MQRFSQAADNNKSAILSALTPLLGHVCSLLEVGSGSGQHVIHMARVLTYLQWQPTERAIELPGLSSNISTYGGANILPPIVLDLAERDWPSKTFDCVYSANVMHIVSKELGENLVRGAASVLSGHGLLILYGPYKYAGEFTAPSNASFDRTLRTRDKHSGVRDFEWVQDVASSCGLTLAEDMPMPANNQLLVFTPG